MSTPLRIGWIGCGRHATEMLLPQLVRHPVRIVALCDVNEEALTRAGDRFGVPAAQRSRDYKAILSRTDIDAIGMAVGPQQHATMAVEALASGRPVFIEKPPGGNSSDARAIADAAAKAGRPAVLGFMKRYSTANRIAANIVHATEFGATAGFLGEYMTAPTYFEGNPDYTGFYLHHCVHYMDLVPFLMGKVASLETRRHEIAPGKLLLQVHFRFANGGIGTLVMGTNQSRATPMEWWQVMGDHRRVEVRNVHEVRYFRAPKFKVDDPAATLLDSEDTLVWEPNLTVAANEDHKGYHAVLGAFVATLRGETVAAPSAADGVRAMELLEAMIRSAEQGGAAQQL